MIPDGARHFEDFDGLVYLNCANQGPLPRVTIQAIREAIGLKSHPNRIDDGIYFRIPGAVRSGASRLIGSRPEDITVGAGASHGMAVAAVGFPWREGDEVVVAENDFPSNIYLWSHNARRHGGKAVVVRGSRYAATTDDVLAAIGPRTRVVSVSLVDFASGEMIDLDRLGPVCRERGIFLAVDATQAVGVMPFDVTRQPVSLLTVAGYKWLLSPYGTGFAYLSPEWAERIEPTFVTWTAAEGAENFNELPRSDWKWVSTGRRYDAPETASFLNLSGMIRSMDFIEEIGLPAIYDHVTGLLRMLEEELPSGFGRRATPSPVPGPILCVESEDRDRIHRAYERLREQKIWTSLRNDGIRVSPHIYNTEEHIERILRVLSESAS